MYTSENKIYSAEYKCIKCRQVNNGNYRRRKSLNSPVSITVLLFLIIQLTVVYCMDEVNSNIDLERLNSCSVQEERSVTSQVEVGWPFQINCDEQLEMLEAFYYYDGVEMLNDTEFQFIVVSSNGDIVHASNITDVGEEINMFFTAQCQTYTIPAVSQSQNQTQFSSYVLTKDSCFKVVHTLVVTEEKSEKTCQEVTYSDDVTLNREFEVGGLYVIECFTEKHNLFLSDAEFEVKWYKDCVEIEESITTNTQTNRQETITVGSLQITNPTFSTAGEYTCSVIYKGKERFLSKTSVCVKHEPYKGPTSLHQISSTTARATPGSDVELTCGGWDGSQSQLSFVLFWYKNNTNQTSSDFICRKYMFNHDEDVDTDKHSCNLLTNREEATKCYTSREEADENPHQGLVKFNSTLRIKNFQDSDIGQYICKVVTTRAPIEVTFNVEKSYTNILLIVIPVLVGFLLIVIVCLLLFACIRSGYIKRRWKKKSEKYAKDIPCKEKDLPKESSA